MTLFKPAAPFLFFILTILQHLNAIDSLAQVAKQNGRFSSINEAGLLTGEKGEALTLQATNGLQKGRSFAGIGVALDYYGLRTIPLFASFRRELSTNKNPLFAYANGGLNFLWLSSAKKAELIAPQASSGYYYDLGVGWKLSGKNASGFVFSAGYTVKQVRYTAPSFTIFSFPQIDGETVDQLSFLYRRIVVKVGLQL